MEQLIRIAHIVGRLDAAGVESVVYSYYRHIDRSRFQFDIYYQTDSSVEPPAELIEMGARFFPIPPYTQLSAYIKTLRNAFLQEKYTVVHSHMNSLSVFPLFAAWSAGVPVRIAHSHNTAAKGETKRNIIKALLRPLSRLFPTHLMCCSRSAGEWLFGTKAFRSGKVFLLCNAIDTQRFTFDPAARVQLRDELGLADNPIFGHVGRFMFQKNHGFLLEMFEEIKKQRPDARLLLIGDGPLRSEIEQKSREMGLSDSVIFLGIRYDVDKLYSAMDMFILPSHYEGLGLVVIESQCCGLPVLVSDRVPSETAIGGAFSSLPLSEAAAVWADRAIELLDRPQDRATGRQLAIAAGYDISSKVRLLEAYYQNAIDGN